MKKNNRHANNARRAARLAALALSAFLLSGSSHAADWIARGHSTDQEIGGIVGGAAWRESLFDMIIIDGSAFIEDNHAIGGSNQAWGGALYATEGGISLRAEGSIIVRSNDVTSDKEARGGAMFTGWEFDNFTGTPRPGVSVILAADAAIEISGNRAHSTGDYAKGGAVYAHYGAEITAGGGVTLSGNTAEGAHAFGGAIYSENSIVTVTGDSIAVIGNRAKATSSDGYAHGGAIYAKSDITLTGGAISFDLNTAEGPHASGGAIHSQSGTVKLTGDSISFTHNSVSNPGSDNGDGTALGGAIYADEKSIDISAAESLQLIGNSAAGDNASGSALWAKGNIVLRGGVIRVQSNDVKFTNGTAGNGDMGGALYARGSNPEAIDRVDGAVTLTGTAIELTDNSISGPADASGGAVGAENDVTISADGRVAVSRNTASGLTVSGGAVYSHFGGIVLHGESVTVDGNAASGGTALGGALRGGALRGGRVSVSGGEISFENNTASGDYARGGAIWAGGGSNTLSGDSIAVTGNKASGKKQAYGGAIYSEYGRITLTGDTIAVTGNEASATNSGGAFGGAIYSGGMDLVGDSIAVTGNEATATADGGTASGGAIYSSRGVGLMGDSIAVTGNKATGGTVASGGAIYSSIGVGLMGDSIAVTGNKASGSLEASGGAIFASGDVVELTGGTISFDQNTVSGGKYARGGALASFSALDANGNPFHNVVKLSGDTICFEGNTAEGGSDAYGGALASFRALDSNGKPIAHDGMELSGDTIRFEGNTAEGGSNAYGGAVYADGSVNITAGTVTFAGNSASSSGGTARGGAVWANNDISLTAKDIFVKTAGDTFWSENGSIVIDGSLTAAPGATFVAKNGAVQLKNGVLTLTGVPHADDVAAVQLAVFAGSDLKMEFTNLSIAGADAAGRSYDVAILGHGPTFVPVQGFQPKNPRYAVDYVNYDTAAHDTQPELTGFPAADKVVVFVASADLVWNAGDGAWFAGSKTAYDPKNWAHSSDMSMRDWFLNGDRATFTAEHQGTVTVSGDVRAHALTVTGGEYTFASAPGRGTITVEEETLVHGSTTSVTLSAPLATKRYSQQGDALTVSGGRIESRHGIGVENVASVTVTGNELDAAGGAAYGGALRAGWDEVALSAAAVELSGNSAQGANGAYGGAAFASGDIRLSGASLSVSGNKACGGSEARGGALASFAVRDENDNLINYGNVTLTGGAISFDRNTAAAVNGDASGGAIYSDGDVNITADTIAFNGNQASARNKAQGGAIYSDGGVSLTGAATLSGNQARGRDAAGGAIKAANVRMTVDSLLAEDNVAAGEYACGGAVTAAGELSLSSRGGIVMRGNRAEGVYAYAGAAGAASVTMTAADAIEFSGNETVMTLSAADFAAMDADEQAYKRAMYGGALVAYDGVSLSADQVIFDGNRFDNELGLARGAVLTMLGSVDITAHRVEFRTAGDSVTAGSGVETLGGAASADIRITGTLHAAAGANFIAPYGAITAGGGELELYPAHSGAAADVSELAAFAARKIDFSGAELELVGEMPVETGRHYLDFAAIALPENGVFLSPDISGYRNASLHSRSADIGAGGGELAGLKNKGFAGQILTLEYVNSALTWNGGDNGAWAVHGGAKGWIVDETGGSDDFYLGDDVTFGPDKAGAVSLSGDIEAAEMTVAGGTYDFRLGGNVLDVWYLNVDDGEASFSDGAVSTGRVTVSGGKAVFEQDAHVTAHVFDAKSGTTTIAGAFDAEEEFLVGGTADVTVTGKAKTLDAVLSGGKLTLGAPGALTAGSFTQNGGTLFVDGASARSGAVIVGEGEDAMLDRAAGGLNLSGVSQISKAGTTYHIASGFKTLNNVWTAEDVTHDADPSTPHLRYAVETPEANGKKDVNVTFWGGNVNLAWNGGVGNKKRWTIGGTGWTISDDTFAGGRFNGEAEVFLEGDSATFAGKGGVVDVAGPRITARNVTVDGNYEFGGSRLEVLGDLSVIGGQVCFNNAIRARDVVLSGKNTELALGQRLKIDGSFTQRAGSTLVVDVTKLGRGLALSGSSGMKLTIESGAKLKLKGDLAGRTYTIASGFSVEKAWDSADVSGQSSYDYTVQVEGNSVKVTGTLDRSDHIAPETDDGDGHIVRSNSMIVGVSAIGALGRAARLGGAVQGHVVSLTREANFAVANGVFERKSIAKGFLPLGQDKTGGVWASTWYSHARIDNAMADSTFKNYGVTIGADKRIGAGLAGLAIDLGKSEGRGKGQFDGADSDGKHIGVSLYGGRAIAGGRFTLTGDIGYAWHSSDYDILSDGAYYSARKAKSRVFTAGGTAWWNLRDNGKVSVKPFVGVRYSRFSMDDFTMRKDGADWATIGGESVSQWTVPLGVKFDWTPATTKRGWKIKPSVELAYVYAGGDRAMTVRETQFSGGGAARSTQMLTDRNNFRASIGLDAKRKDFTLGLGVNALLSSGQKDVSVNATLRWDL